MTYIKLSLLAHFSFYFYLCDYGCNMYVTEEGTHG